jgi:hypothetical protein
MTQTEFQAQLKAIKNVTEEALKSKEAAHKFLVDAGIVQDEEMGHLSKSSDIKKK